MGQASSHEKKRRGKKSTRSPVSAAEENTAPKRKTSLNKNGKKKSKGVNKKTKNLSDSGGPENTGVPEQMTIETPTSLDLTEITCFVDEHISPSSPRYGIFDDFKPTVCIDDDGVSLSSASSDEEAILKRNVPSKGKTTLRGSSRRLRRTYSSKRRKSRAARIAKKNQTQKELEQVPKHRETKSKENEHPEIIASVDSRDVFADEASAGDDSGCSTLEDNLFPDDSLSEEVLGCLVSRGVDFDHDLPAVTDSVQEAPQSVTKSRKDEGYESLQKIVIEGEVLPQTGSLTEVRNLIFTPTDKHVGDLPAIEMGNWTLRKSSLSSSEQEESKTFGKESHSAILNNDTKPVNTCSLSDSGYSSKMHKSELDAEAVDVITGGTEGSLSESRDSENIDWLESSPAFVDNTFNEHFQKVLRLPMTSIFYEAADDGEVKVKSPLSAVPDDRLDDTVSMEELTNSQSSELDVTGDVTDEGCDVSVQTGSSPSSPTATNGVNFGQTPNLKSEVYV